MSLQGLPWLDIAQKTVDAQMPNSALIDLAGNAFSAFALFPLLVAFFATADVVWVESSESSRMGAVPSMLDAIGDDGDEPMSLTPGK